MIAFIVSFLLNMALIAFAVWRRRAPEVALMRGDKIPVEQDRIARGQQAERALEQFLAPAFEYVIAEYMRKLTEIASEQPWETDKIRKLAAGAKIARTVQSAITAFVHDGEAAMKEKRTADRMANMTDAQSRWAKMAGGIVS